MTSPTEKQLRELFAADATGAPRSADLAGGALRKVRRRRRVQLAGVGGLVAAVVVVGGVASGWSPTGPGAPSDAVADADTAPPTGVGALGSEAQDCAAGYSPANLAAHLTREGAFALDGTVTEIEPGPDLGPEMPTQYSTVTFRVDTWFHGGSGETVDVFLDPPYVGSQTSDVGSYGVGTRLLVSGVVGDTERPSGTMTVTEDTGYFGFSCGGTRYYDEQTAAEWTAVAAGELPAGPLPTAEAASCPEYSPALVAQQDFALDGTVTEIGAPRFGPEPAGSAPDTYLEVTFRVHGWYRGGTGETVSLHLENPYTQLPEGSPDTYFVGTRLLVSGVASEIEGQGLIGQGCGFTRYFDAQTAAEWAAATD
ncbi:hypothetical protein [Candidatus Blastococcus massiliensis]|uniref:hypothetical protein n=1 Tax=Candidatus Blastococcus massiliensis TaxID=1470358 RepID=UPI0004B6A408|nr:hypothetical protein [Candidatus Blastococcus massiliensis]